MLQIPTVMLGFFLFPRFRSYTSLITIFTMLIFGITSVILGVAILFNPALLGFLVGLFLFILGSWIILGWYKVNKVLEKEYSFGKYNIIFQKRDNHNKHS